MTVPTNHAPDTGVRVRRARAVRTCLSTRAVAALAAAGAVLIPGAALRAQAPQPGHTGTVPPVVYVSRTFGDEAVSGVEREGRTEAVERARSGRLLVYDEGMGPEQATRVLVDANAPGAVPGTPTDVADPCVSDNASRIAFSGYHPGEQGWRIYTVRSDGTDLEQVTTSDRATDLARHGDAAPALRGHDDLDPCWLPDGRIVFVSTRYPGVAPRGRVRATNLYVVDPEGGPPHRITSERFGADTPAIDPQTGHIVYSRWWMSPNRAEGTAPDREAAGPLGVNPFDKALRGISDDEYPGVNTWSLAPIRPDGDGLSMFRGDGRGSTQTVAYRPAFGSSGEAVWLAIADSPLLGVPGRHALIFSTPEAAPVTLGGPADLLPRANYYGDGENGRPVPGLPIFLYASAELLPSGDLLVTGESPPPEGSPRYDVFVQRRERVGSARASFARPVKLTGDEKTQELDAVPLVPRETDVPVLRDRVEPLATDLVPRTVEEAEALHGTFRFVVENIFGSGPADAPMTGAPPIGQGLVLEFWMNPQRTGVGDLEEPILVGREPVGADGRVEAELPAGVPLFEVLRTGSGEIALGRDGQAFHVGGMNFGAPGSTGRCVGCHAGHSMLEVPDDPRWANIAPSADIAASSQSDEALRLIDRRTGGRETGWESRGSESPVWVDLRWPVPVEARELVLRAKRDSDAGRDIREYDVLAWHGDAAREPRQIHGHLVEPEGTSVSLRSTGTFDRLRVRFWPRPRGPEVALSEVEVMGRAVGSPAGFAVRGDTDCDGHVAISDAIRLLDTLFRGTGPLCCEAASDVNGDGERNISDGGHLLFWLFRGGSPPAGPEGAGRRCTEIPVGRFTCLERTCP